MKKRQHRPTSKEAHDSVKAVFKNLNIESMPGESWMTIVGYEGRFEISNMGRIKSIGRKVVRRSGSHHYTRDMIKKQRLTDFGYLTVYLSINKKYRHKFVHVLVGIHFIPNPDNKPEVNHKWGNKMDNRASELEWVTKSENILHAYKIGVMSQKGENHASNKLTNSQVVAIFKSIDVHRKLAEKYNVCIQSISNIKNGRTWSHLNLTKNDK